MWPTPLLKLKIGSEVWAKLEFYNPFSRSIKDRTAWFLFMDVLRRGYSKIVDATSGNTGIALASLARIYNKEFIAFLPQTSAKVFKSFMKILGAKIIEAGNSTNEILPLVRQFASSFNIYHVDQFTNVANLIAHYETTAKELDEQLRSIGKKPERIIATMGTAGHIAGIAKYFKERYGKSIEIIGVQPAEGEKIPGIKRQSEDNVFLKQVEIDKVIDVTFKEAMYGILEVARTSGILFGFSGGACVAAYSKLKDDKLTVLIIPDDLYKYVYEVSELEEEILKGNSE
ncbi:MAG: cysteine synthase family protein [Sulfolobaceae archaeon]